MSEIDLSDDELNRLLDELGFHAKEERKKTLFYETFKHTIPKKETEVNKTSLKNSLFLTLVILLFVLVQASFILPLFKSIKHLEKKIERIESMLEETKNTPPFQQYPEEEIIIPTESIAPQLYNNA